MSNQPLNKGRLAVIVDRYPTGEYDQQGAPVMKPRYATVGRVTQWPAKEGSVMPNIEIELDSLPIGVTGPVKLLTFWDDQPAQNNSHTPSQGNAPAGRQNFNQQQPGPGQTAQPNGGYQQQQQGAGYGQHRR